MLNSIAVACSRAPKRLTIGIGAILCISAAAASAQDEFDVAAPPTVTTTKEYTSPPATDSQEPAVPASPEAPTSVPATPDESAATEPATGANRIFGKATITELKRENGQTYSIEIKHSQGAKQYIEDTDADGLTDGKTKDIDDTPNIAKWRLGSW